METQRLKPYLPTVAAFLLGSTSASVGVHVASRGLHVNLLVEVVYSRGVRLQLYVRDRVCTNLCRELVLFP